MRGIQKPEFLLNRSGRVVVFLGITSLYSVDNLGRQVVWTDSWWTTFTQPMGFSRSYPHYPQVLLLRIVNLTVEYRSIKQMKLFEIRCIKCGELAKLEKDDDGACGDPECCSGREEWVNAVCKKCKTSEKIEP
jgi:hypothetical protein